MPSNWLVFDRIRALARQGRVYGFERVFQDQSNLDRLTSGGEFLDFNNQAAILDQTNLQINRLERYKDYEQMDQTGEISLALDLYSDEGCVVGTTRIPLLDGSCPTIAELAERGPDHEFWVYAFDQKTDRYVPALARGARVTGRDQRVIKVTFDDGESIECTANHLFMLRDGSFREAGDLLPDDSLKPLYKKRRYRERGGKTLFDQAPYPTATAYEYFFNGKNYTSTHRWVYHSFSDDLPEVVHHTNYNSLDNTPANLVGLTVVEHDTIHRRYGPENPSYNRISFEDVRTVARDWHGPLTREDLCAACDIGDRVLNRLLVEAGVTWSSFRDRYHRCGCCDRSLTGSGRVCGSCRREYLRDYHQRRKNDAAYRERRNASKRRSYQPVSDRTCVQCTEIKSATEFQKKGAAYSPYCETCRPTACPKRYLDKSFSNHKVVSVEAVGIVDKVYDIEVPGFHCFAAGTSKSWVIIHNSLVDPERKHTLIIRAKNRRLKRELEELFFNTLQWDTYCRPSIRYLCKYGDMPFEVILDQHRTAVASLKFMSVYNFTRIETRYGDLIGFFYMDALWPRPQFLHPWQVMHLRLTSFENTYHPYGRCCKIGTNVGTPNGPVAIENIKVGDMVYAWDGTKAVPRKVTGWVASGKKRIWKIKTRHHSIECSGNHPILIDGKGYVQADQLKRGDRVIVPKTAHADETIPLNLTTGNANSVVPLVPAHVDETFARLMGFLAGDGWATPTSVEFALGVHEEVNKRYIDILNSYGLHCAIRTNGVGTPIAAVCSSVLLSRLMRDMGLIGKAHEKKIPAWVFRASASVKQAFLDGYSDADGCEYTERSGSVRYHLRSTSSVLLTGSKHLLQSLGYKCGKVSKPIKNSSMICGRIVNAKLIYQMSSYRTPTVSGCLTDVATIETAVASNTGYAGVLRSLGYNAHGSMFQLLKDRCTEYGIDTSHFKGVAWNKGGAAVAVNAAVAKSEMWYVTENILSIVDTGVDEETYDIQVDGFSNFLADGIVVHNSILDGGRKAFKQLRLMEDAALIYRITRAPEKRKFTIPVGLIPPKEVPEYMQMIARNFKRQRFYNPSTGSFDERYSPLIQEDDFFLPRRPDGTGPDVDVLPGGENVDKIADIEYFKKKMIAPMKIPFARVGIGEEGGGSSEKSLSQSHSEFAKAVQWVQREMATGLTKVAIIHLALRGYQVEDLKGFEIALTATSAMEELYRIETWQTRAGVMTDLKDLGWFPKEWIVTNFTDLSPDEIEELKEMSVEAVAGGGGGGGGGGGLDVPTDPAAAGGDVPTDPAAAGAGAEAAAMTDPNAMPVESRLPGYDWETDRRIISESIKTKNRDKTMGLVRRLAERLGKPLFAEDREFTSGFQHVLESKELDGLCRGKPNSIKQVVSEGSEAFLLQDPNNDSGLMVEWSVPKDTRDEVIREVYNVITAGIDLPAGPETDDITESDLPLAVSGL